MEVATEQILIARAEELRRGNKPLFEDPLYSGDEYFIFKFGQVIYAILINHIVEVIDFMPLIPMPTAASHFLGIMQWRGEIVCIVDIRNNLEIVHDEPNSEQVKWVICDTGNFLCGILVNEVIEKITIHQKDILNLNNSLMLQRFVNSGLKWQNRIVGILEIPSLLQQPEFLMG